MNPYYLLWAMLITISLAASVGAFLFAYRHNQFRDQDRARFLPLRGEEGPVPPEKESGIRPHLLAMPAILLVGVTAIAIALFMTIFATPGGRP